MFCIKLQCNGIFDRNIFSSGYPTKSENYGNSRGQGDDKYPLERKFQGSGSVKQKCPPWRGIGYFLELHNQNFFLLKAAMTISRTHLKLWLFSTIVDNSGLSRTKSTSLFLVTTLRLNRSCEAQLMWKGKNCRNRLRLMSVFNVQNHVYRETWFKFFLPLRQFIT